MVYFTLHIALCYIVNRIRIQLARHYLLRFNIINKLFHTYNLKLIIIFFSSIEIP